MTDPAVTEAVASESAGCDSGLRLATLRTAGALLFFRRRPAWPLAIMRILYGLVLLVWTTTMALDATALLGTDAIVPTALSSENWWQWLRPDTTAAMWMMLGLLAFASIAITVGWRPTVWLVLAFALLASLSRRNPAIFNSGDLLLRDLALLLALTPTGAAMSVDRWRRHGRHALRTAPMVAPWGLRLVQLQVMVIYLVAFWSKRGDLWRNGTAVATVIQIGDITRFTSPDWLIGNVVIIAVLTWGTLAVELSLGTLLWVKRLRPALIVLGIVLHVFIDLFVVVGFFGPLMIIGLLSFTDAEAIGRRVQRVRPEVLYS